MRRSLVPTGGTARRGWRGWRGWSRRTEVERVRLYTVTSLQVLVWLTLPLIVLTSAADRHPRLALLMVAAAVALGAVASRLLAAAVPAYPVRGLPPRGPTLVMTGLAVVVVAGSVALPGGFGGVGGALVSVALAWGLGGFRDRRVGLALLVACPLALVVVEPAWASAAFGLAVCGFFVFTVRSSLWLLGVVTELDRARGAQAALAVAEERLRFSRDVHDVLGRRLAAISLQAELAAALARRGDPAAGDRMTEVQGTAHDALREARELARGYRPASLDQELDGARSLLRAAGIAADVDVAGLPEAWHEPAAWVVREAVTNVLRHSAATAVTIAYDGRRLSVRNDGAVRAPGPDGTGLTGLAERLAPLGAAVESRREGGDHVLAASLPADRTPS